MDSQYPLEIKLTKLGQVAVLKMSGSEIRINRIFLEQWMKALDEVESWPDVKALITTGSGNYYCSGLDHDYLSSSSKVEFAKYAKISRRFRERLLCFPMSSTKRQRILEHE